MIKVSRIEKMIMSEGENRDYLNYRHYRVKLGVELGILVDWICFAYKLRWMDWQRIWVMKLERVWSGVTYRLRR